MKQIIVLVVAVILGLYFYVFNISNDTQQYPIIETYSNSETGIEFKYPVGPFGYVLSESETTDPRSGLVRALVLTRSEDAEKGVPVGGEGPATITMQIFRSMDKQSPRTWAEKNIQYSNLNLKMGEIRNITIDGRDAVSYMADGLYASENIIVINGDYVYLISGMFIDTESQLRKDFSPFVESIRFVPPQVGGGQGKLDINTVCEGALAYMTFPDGKSADAFVAECKEGKHPEVIEQYKAQMGLGDGVVL